MFFVSKTNDEYAVELNHYDVTAFLARWFSFSLISTISFKTIVYSLIPVNCLNVDFCLTSIKSPKCTKLTIIFWVSYSVNLNKASPRGSQAPCSAIHKSERSAHKIVSILFSHTKSFGLHILGRPFNFFLCGSLGQTTGLQGHCHSS